MGGEGGIRGINICWSYRLGYLVMMMVLVWVFLSFFLSFIPFFSRSLFSPPFLIQLPLNVHIELNVPFFQAYRNVNSIWMWLYAVAQWTIPLRSIAIHLGGQAELTARVSSFGLVVSVSLCVQYNNNTQSHILQTHHAFTSTLYYFSYFRCWFQKNFNLIIFAWNLLDNYGAKI